MPEEVNLRNTSIIIYYYYMVYDYILYIIILVVHDVFTLLLGLKYKGTLPIFSYLFFIGLG